MVLRCNEKKTNINTQSECGYFGVFKNYRRGRGRGCGKGGNGSLTNRRHLYSVQNKSKRMTVFVGISGGIAGDGRLSGRFFRATKNRGDFRSVFFPHRTSIRLGCKQKSGPGGGWGVANIFLTFRAIFAANRPFRPIRNVGEFESKRYEKSQVSRDAPCYLN